MKLKIAFACVCMLIQIGSLSANEKTLFQGYCVDENDQCKSQYEQYLKRKMQEKGFLQREITKRRAYPYIDKAFAFFRAGKVQQAIAEFDKYLAVDPAHDLIRWYQLVMLSTLKEDNKIIKVASEFINRNKDSGPAYFIRGNAYWNAGELNKAEKDFLKARATNLFGYVSPKDVLLSLYLMAYSQADYGKANKWINELPRSVRNTPEVRIVQANLYEKMNKDDAAIVEWRDVLHQTNQQSEKYKALVALGNLYGKRAEYAQAFEYFSRALEFEENNTTRISAAEMAWDAGKYLAAQTLIEPIIHAGSFSGNSELDLRYRYCETFDKLGDLSRASECIKTLTENYPDHQPLISYHADLAHRRGNRSEYIASLKRLYTEKSSAKTANIIAYALEKQGKFAEAEQWHRKSFSASDDPAYALAYGNSLLRNVRLYKSIGIFRRVVKNKKSTEQQREYAYSSMANAYLKKKQYQKADEAWEQAFAKSRNPVHILHRVVTNNLAERFDVSYRLISTFGTDLPSGLPEEFHNDWYAAAGKVYFKNKKYADSQAVLKKLVARAPSANHYLLLADSYRAAGDTRKADAAYLHAARFAENEGSSLIERAYIHKRAGNDAAAEQLFLQALKASPDNAQASEELGYISLADHRNQEAADYFKAVLDEHEKRAQKEHDDNDLKNKQENLNSLIATLEDKWTFSFHDSFCLGGKGCESGSEGVISPFGQGFGQAEITYRPDRYGYRNGRELLIFSRLLWRNKADTFLALKGSQQATVGVRYKPVARQNFWVSAEYMPELGSDTEEHILLRTAWSKTSGNDWRLKDLREFNGYRFKDYTNLYVDAGKLFKNTDPFLVYAEGRKGKTMLLNRQNLLSGFGYLRGSFEFDNDSSNVVDAGIGIEARYRNRFDRYHGYQTEWSLLFRLGQEIINSQSDKDSRANLGISVHF